MTTPQPPSADTILDKIDKDVFDCADALQNALSCLDPLNVDRLTDYLTDWPPKWMREDTFTPSETPAKLGTDKLREYIHALEGRCREMRLALHRISKCDMEEGQFCPSCRITAQKALAADIS